MPPDPLAGVSRETTERLSRYVDLLLSWNRTINLIGPADAASVWDRHIRDSAQLHPLGRSGTWCDLGSGGGLPVIVVAIIDQGEREYLCVESDLRKATFLRTVARDLGLPLHVQAKRIEDLPPKNAATVSARALAPLDRLLGLVHRHLHGTGRALLMKGRTWREELEAAHRTWHFSVEVTPSVTDPDAVILQIGDLERA